MPKTVHRCGQCDVEVKNTDSYVQCASCLIYYHRKCTELSNGEFEALYEASTKVKTRRALKYFCPICEEPVADVLSNIQKFKKMSIELKNIQQEIENKLNEFNKRLIKCEEMNKKNTSLSERVKKTEQKIENNIPSNPEMVKRIKENVEKIEEQAEKEEIEKKKSNLIYFGIPESEEEDIVARIRHDKTKFLEMYKKDSGTFDEDTIETQYRIGKRETGKNRPLIVRYASIEIKHEYLKASRNLTLKVEHENKRVYVTNDLTKNQRAQLKKNLVDLQARKNGGETDLVIRNQKIVKKSQNFSQEDREGVSRPIQRASYASVFKRNL